MTWLHMQRHGTDELSEKWKQTTAYSLRSARVIWQSFVDDGLVQQSKPASNAHIVQWSEKQVEEFSDKRVRREIEQLTHTVQELKKEPREHEFLRWLLGMGGVVVSLQETRTSMPLHERVCFERENQTQNARALECHQPAHAYGNYPVCSY